MAQNVVRTSDQQEYRDNLAKNLRKFRQQGDKGKEFAKVLLAKGQGTNEYKEAKIGITAEQLQKNLKQEFDDILEIGKFYNDKNSIAKYSDKTDAIYDILELMKERKIDLTEELKIDLKNIILLGWNEETRYLNTANESAFNLLMQNIEQFSQEDKEELMDKAVKKYKGSTEKDYYRFPKGLYKFDLSSAKIDESIIKTLIFESLKESNNEGFILNMLIVLLDGINGEVSEIPEHCISILSDSDKLNKAIEAYGGSDFDIRFRLLPALDKLGINIDDSLFLTKLGLDNAKYEGKNIYNTAIDVGGKDLEKLVDLVSRKYFRKKVDDKYKSPGFINSHLEDLGNLKPVLKYGGWRSLLQESNEKFNAGAKFDIGFLQRIYKEGGETIVSEDIILIKKYFDLSKLVAEDFYNSEMQPDEMNGRYYFDWFANYWLLQQMEGGVPKAYFNELFDYMAVEVNRKNIGELLKNNASTILQDVYATQDNELLKKLFLNIGAFGPYVSQEDINVIVNKMIKSISTQEDFDFFYEQLNDDMGSYMYTDSKFAILLKLKTVLSAKFNKYYINQAEEIPSDIYQQLIESGIIDVASDKPLPEVGASVFVDPDDIDKLLQYHSTMEKDKGTSDEGKNIREKRLEDEVKKNWEQGEVILDYGEEGQKFVLSINREKRNLQFLSENLNQHSNIHRKYIKAGECLGGGRIKMDKKHKMITLYGYSESYGSVPQEYRESMKKMLEKEFPGYNIEIS